MKILVVSGFLGAGKTTFITHMFRACSRKFVVMENEMGAVGVDGGLLSASLAKDAKIWELTEGCICCSMQTDFATSVLTIESALSPEYLLVEPTGVGMLSRIVENIRKIAYERIEVLSPLTILDACNYRMTAREYPDIFSDQITAAGTVVLSKTDMLSPDEQAAAEAFVREHAPNAAIVAAPYTQLPPEWFDALWRRTLDGAMLPGPVDADAGLVNAGFSDMHCPSAAWLAIFLESLVRGEFGSVVRAKGIAASPDGRLRFDVVNGVYSVSGMDDAEQDGPANAVFIGKDIRTDKLRAALLAAPVDEHEHHHDHDHHE